MPPNFELLRRETTMLKGVIEQMYDFFDLFQISEAEFNRYVQYEKLSKSEEFKVRTLRLVIRRIHSAPPEKAELLYKQVTQALKE
jgi:hypothetical protein